MRGCLSEAGCLYHRSVWQITAFMASALFSRHLIEIITIGAPYKARKWRNKFNANLLAMEQANNLQLVTPKYIL